MRIGDTTSGMTPIMGYFLVDFEIITSQDLSGKTQTNELGEKIMRNVTPAFFR